MARDETPAFAAVRDALDCRTVEELKKLLALLLATEKPTRKGEIAGLVASHLEGDRMNALWKRLDATQQAAVAETLYAAGGQFDGVRFAAKYGESPDWGKRRGLGYDRTPSLLRLFIQERVIADGLQARLREFVTRPAETVLETFPDDKLPQKVVRQVEWWDAATNKPVRETEDVPVICRDTARIAAGELQAVLDGGDYYGSEDACDGIEPAGPIRAFAWPPAAPPSPRLWSSAPKGSGRTWAASCASCWPRFTRSR